ncbi:carboxypeptidase regulatory-like domain-containing protein [Winogradskyella sp. PAMC22761]|nr:carboxypeptidase regulatory-like domain-containing protein [Winogradskyella sp. PAMC22761]
MHRILFILSLVSSLFCFSQNLKIKTVEYIKLNSISDVKILVLDNNGSITTITSTDKKGTIVLDIPYGSYTIKASHLAFEKWNQKIIFDETNSTITIKMMQRIEDLDEVLINASGYIRKHGDTTTVSLPKIVNGKERNVIDVLKK